jgi:hypothetical protein
VLSTPTDRRTLVALGVRECASPPPSSLVSTAASSPSTPFSVSHLYPRPPHAAGHRLRHRRPPFVAPRPWTPPPKKGTIPSPSTRLSGKLLPPPPCSVGSSSRSGVAPADLVARKLPVGPSWPCLCAYRGHGDRVSRVALCRLAWAGQTDLATGPSQLAEALGWEAGPTLCVDFILFWIELNSQKLSKFLKYIKME